MSCTRSRLRGLAHGRLCGCASYLKLSRLFVPRRRHPPRMKMADVVSLDRKRQANATSIAHSIFAWLNQVKADKTLFASDFKVAFQMTQKTSTAMFERSGELLTWQSRPLIAAEVSMSERTVHDCVKRLSAGHHVAATPGRGPGRSNCYRLIQHRQPVAAYNRQPTAAIARQPTSLKHATDDSKCGSPLPPNNIYNHSNNRNRPDHAPQNTKELTGSLPISGLPKEVATGLKQQHGDDVYRSWFANLVFVGSTDGEVTIMASTKFNASWINNHYADHLLDHWKNIDPDVRRVVAMGLQ